MSKHFSAVVTRDKGRCIYCGKDLLNSFDDFWTIQEDHLVPKTVRPDLADEESNIVTSCFVCNNLKGKYFPKELLHLDPRQQKEREVLIQKLRAYVFERRAEEFELYQGWIR